MAFAKSWQGLFVEFSTLFLPQGEQEKPLHVKALRI
jgi:hypothetical protein